MSESEKPFACPSPGCNMSFVNEDHLTVHRKKHDMILNLGSNGKSAVFVADQTPTPTRFIRNCEEVGLFQDLQNVNPFEETFRRAVEAGKSGTLAVPEVDMLDDTLHTPHIFPHIADVQSTNGQDLIENGVTDTPVISITDSLDDKTEDSNSIKVCTNGIDRTNDSKKTELIELDEDSQEPTIVETIVVQDQNASVSTTTVNLSNETSQLSINGKEVQLLMKTEDGKLMQLSAIPVPRSQIYPASINAQSSAQTVVIKTEPSLNYSENNRTAKSASSRLSLAKMKLKQVLMKNGVTPDSHPELESTNNLNEESGNGNSGVSNLNKKQEILERNRASSMRARAKRKAWIQQLERSVYSVNETNAVLQFEVRALRSEVVKLKTLLLAHKDCPVTKAMEKGNSDEILGPKEIPFNANAVQVTPVTKSGRAVKRVSIITTDVETLSKKKSLIPTVATNPMILPKSSVNVNPSKNKEKIVKNQSAVKLVDIKHVITKRDKEKPILTANNQKRKCVENSRQIIRINPNFELENAASKTTGS